MPLLYLITASLNMQSSCQMTPRYLVFIFGFRNPHLSCGLKKTSFRIESVGRDAAIDHLVLTKQTSEIIIAILFQNCNVT